MYAWFTSLEFFARSPHIHACSTTCTALEMAFHFFLLGVNCDMVAISIFAMMHDAQNVYKSLY